MGITFWLSVVYAVVLIICVAFSNMDVNGLNTSGWIKVIFWPITVLVFLLGVILQLFIKLFKGIYTCFYEIKDFFIKLFKGICICFYEIKDFFIDIFYSTIEDEN